MTGTSGYSAYVSGQSFYGPDTTLGPWVRPVVAASTGAMIGMFAGLVLHLCGYRFIFEPSRRVGLVVVAGLIGVTLGMTPVLILVGTSFSGQSSGVPTDYLLPIYAGTGIFDYVIGIASVWLLLRATHDPLPSRTTKVVAAFLPIGGVLATLAGMGTAWILGFSTTASTFVAVMVAVLCVLVATFALARAWALRTTAQEFEGRSRCAQCCSHNLRGQGEGPTHREIARPTNPRCQLQR
ncbi:hypothetical protein ACN9MI_07945 [Rhodococcoides fascians]|uniref:hypothetical protein n=1 Tax=Rhodococcoides fascians TaxID=1828 RepID=UPI0012D2B6E3|nr:hypothetical protein [Rhodococcus fascians]WQH30030.1 hypothetical protein U2G91_08895 [Rhodococcus fascians]